jgi:hypothetical protein
MKSFSRLKTASIIYLLLASVNLPGQTKIAHTVTCNNYLYIKGESNINEFTFYHNSIPVHESNSDYSGDSIKISIPVKEFEASNSFMYRDFLELMKEERYPRIYVSFSIKQIENAIRRIDSCPEILITIAGITRKYSVDCKVQECSGNYYLKGKEVIKLSDFSLKPPARLLGMIKVNNEIAVDFGFIINFGSNSNFSVKL